MEARDSVRKLTVSVLGLGYLPLAPGTWASAGAAAVYVLVYWTLPGPVGTILLGGAAVLCFVAGVALGPWAQEHYERQDPRPFVLDDVVGQWLTCLLFRSGTAFGTAIAAFIVFRVFDILKPYPIRKLERLPGGWGIMLDDVGAAVYALLVLLTYGYIVARLA